MNIFPMTQAAEQLNTALQMTINPTERAEIGNIRDRLLGQLRKRGVFIGTEPQAKAASEADGVPWCEPCQSWHDKPKNKEHHAALKCFAPWIEPAAKAASRETSAPKTRRIHSIKCLKCQEPNAQTNTNCFNCGETLPAFVMPPPIMDEDMDEDGLRRDLQRLCQEQQAQIAELTTMRDSLIAALKDTLAPLQDAQNQLHHAAAAAAFINAREIIRHTEPNFARGIS